MRSFVILLALMLVLAAGQAYAFHEGGVAYCAGCHTMHNSQNGAQVDPNSATGHEYLLKFGNSSDTCLNCHAAYGQFYGGTGFGPGGDFYWLTKTFTWSGHGSTSSSPGSSHGHNIISPANGLTADATLTHAPGGDFLASRLTCTSCHDPHGNESFRFLYGSAQGPVYGGTRYDFASDQPLAAGNGRKTTVGSGGNETDAQHTIYKDGMSEWCANCHADFHSDNTNNFVHPEGDMGSTIAANYNAYVSTDDQVSGDQATAYRGLVPFEAVNVDLATATPANYTTGPDGVDKVMCVTCHRAHASAFDDIGRWDFKATFLADSHPLATDGGVGPNDATNKYYQYAFVTNQRSLCNKCHVKDFGDEPRP
jgi:hypothetical protein